MFFNIVYTRTSCVERVTAQAPESDVVTSMLEQ